MKELSVGCLWKQSSCWQQQEGTQVLRAAGASYKVDTDAITLKVKQEFAAKEKKTAAKPKLAQKKKAA